MRALVVGGGSIGARHLQNLKLLGVGPLAVVEPDIRRRRILDQESAVMSLDTFEQGLSWEPDLVFITTPSHLHVEQALAAARRRCHLFIEKPLSHTSDGLSELSNEVSAQGLTSLIGCNLRFHPGPAKVKELLAQKRIGRILFARLHSGSYLPTWRPWQDYREAYSAHAAMGGGCILDCIHEIDLVRWYLGEVEEVFCVAEHLSPLEIDAEDVAILICRHINGSLSEIHLDYVQRTYERGCQIVGEQGSIFWDYRDGAVRWFDADQGRWVTFTQPPGWQVNQMYLDELQHFLTCVQTGAPTVLPIPEAVEAVCIALAAKASARSGCFISPRGVLP